MQRLRSTAAQPARNSVLYILVSLPSRSGPRVAKEHTRPVRHSIGPDPNSVEPVGTFRTDPTTTGLPPRDGTLDTVVAANVLHLVPDLDGAIASQPHHEGLRCIAYPLGYSGCS
jgi:hypothetical protein